MGVSCIKIKIKYLTPCFPVQKKQSFSFPCFFILRSFCLACFSARPLVGQAGWLKVLAAVRLGAAVLVAAVAAVRLLDSCCCRCCQLRSNRFVLLAGLGGGGSLDLNSRNLKWGRKRKS